MKKEEDVKIVSKETAILEDIADYVSIKTEEEKILFLSDKIEISSVKVGDVEIIKLIKRDFSSDEPFLYYIDPELRSRNTFILSLITKMGV
ncbi:MAG: hypothetical protein ACTSQY_00525 [Candidatus Odinarchaeia archaeon]|nr:MAG: hypothetical protein [Lokiarchaeota virus Fenrir Meg22_1012]URC17286.1 MAG: hypothetical protein [Lokiarchaeota virus Fenrir Meg22_1214]